MLLSTVSTCCLYLRVPDGFPVVTLGSDDTVITQSCRVKIPPALILVDANRDGVLHVAAADVVIEFERGAQLRGAARQHLAGREQISMTDWGPCDHASPLV